MRWCLLGWVALAGCSGDDGPANRRDGSERPTLETDLPAVDTDTRGDSDDVHTGTAPPVDTAPPPPTLELHDLTVSHNQTNVVASWVEWRTDVPTTSEVRVPGHPEPFRVFKPDLDTEHRMLVIGLHAETLYDFEVISRDADGAWGTETIAYTTRALPANVPVAEIGARDDAAIAPGWTLVNLSNRPIDSPPVAAMYDRSGQPVWYFENGNRDDLRGDVHVSLIDGPRVLMGPSGDRVAAVEVNLAGTVLWSGPNWPKPRIMHHQLVRLDSGNYLGLQADPVAALKMDHIRIYDPQHDLVWSWRMRDHVTPPPNANYDFSHCNAVEPSLVDPDQFIVSCRNVHMVFAVRRSTGEIVWKLGSDGNLAPDPNANRPWTRWQHAPEPQPDGNILVYDNDGVNAHTRVLEYAIDVQNMRSTIVWEFPGNFQVAPWYRESWKSHIWGDADRLPNGNTLVCFGQRVAKRSRVFEVTADGRVVWEAMFPGQPGYVTGLYRADRVVPPLIEPI